MVDTSFTTHYNSCKIKRAKPKIEVRPIRRENVEKVEIAPTDADDNIKQQAPQTTPAPTVPPEPIPETLTPPPPPPLERYTRGRHTTATGTRANTINKVAQAVSTSKERTTLGVRA